MLDTIQFPKSLYDLAKLASLNIQITHALYHHGLHPKEVHSSRPSPQAVIFQRLANSRNAKMRIRCSISASGWPLPPYGYLLKYGGPFAPRTSRFDSAYSKAQIWSDRRTSSHTTHPPHLNLDLSVPLHSLVFCLQHLVNVMSSVCNTLSFYCILSETTSLLVPIATP